MTTIGGVFFRYLDRLPKVGDSVAMDGYVATVLEMDGHRLARVRVAKGTLEDLKESDSEAQESGAEAADGAGASVVHLPREQVPEQDGAEFHGQATDMTTDGGESGARDGPAPDRRAPEVDQPKNKQSAESVSDRGPMDRTGNKSPRRRGERG